MIYRNFAIATLLAAPLIVMAAQSLLPKHASAPQDQPAIMADVPTPVVLPVAPIVPPIAPPVDAASPFAQPMADAYQPALAPGVGLPDTSAPPISGGMATGSSPQDAPIGSPDGE